MSNKVYTVTLYVDHCYHLLGTFTTLERAEQVCEETHALIKCHDYSSIQIDILPLDETVYYTDDMFPTS